MSYSKLVKRKEDIADGAITNAQLAGSITNSKLLVPKVVTYQETISFDDFTDGGSTAGTLELSTTIPAGAVFMQALIDDVTGFTGDTSAVMTIGDGSDVDRYNTGTPNVFATATAISAGAPSGTAFHSAAATPTITVTSNADFTSVSAGAATITLFYYLG